LQKTSCEFPYGDRFVKQHPYRTDAVAERTRISCRACAGSRCDLTRQRRFVAARATHSGSELPAAARAARSLGLYQGPVTVHRLTFLLYDENLLKQVEKSQKKSSIMLYFHLNAFFNGNRCRINACKKMFTESGTQADSFFSPASEKAAGAAGVSAACLL
jgi:hypothetical protein